MNVAEERLMRRLPSFIPLSQSPDPSPTSAVPNPLVARVEQFPLSTPARSNGSNWLYKSKSVQSRYLHGLRFYTAGEGGTKAQKGGVVNVLLAGYGGESNILSLDPIKTLTFPSRLISLTQ